MSDIFFEIEKKLSFKKEVALFGAGHNGKRVFDFLVEKEYTVICFIDNNPKFENSFINDIPVYSYADFIKNNFNCPLFITVLDAVIPIMKQLNDYQFKMSFDAWFYLKNKEEFETIKDGFVDEKSKLVLNGKIKAMLSGDKKYFAEIVENEQYFCLPHFFNTCGEVFLDLGAYVGDTVEKFIYSQGGLYKHIYAFEPSTPQFNAARIRFKRLIEEWALDENSISLIKAGVARETSKMYINTHDKHLASNAISVHREEHEQVQVYALDDFFKDINVSFVKVDIEGSEIEMLKGFKNVIKRDKPKFALSVYHRADDLFNAIKLLKECVPNYQFALRHHSTSFSETVLYCWVE